MTPLSCDSRRLGSKAFMSDMLPLLRLNFGDSSPAGWRYRQESAQATENSLCKLFTFKSYSSAEIKLAQNTITF